MPKHRSLCLTEGKTLGNIKRGKGPDKRPTKPPPSPSRNFKDLCSYQRFLYRQSMHRVQWDGICVDLGEEEDET